MTNTPAQGAAFPIEGYSNGIYIRDYFSAQLMPAIIGSLNGSVTGEEYPGDFYRYATCAYHMADAMIRAREAS